MIFIKTFYDIMSPFGDDNVRRSYLMMFEKVMLNIAYFTSFTQIDVDNKLKGHMEVLSCHAWGADKYLRPSAFTMVVPRTT